MLSPAQLLERRGLPLGALIAILLGIFIVAPSDSKVPPASDGWTIQYGPAARAGGAPAATPASAPASPAVGAPAQSVAEADASAASQGDGEGEVTMDLPAGYIPGTAPSADLAAVLRQSQQRNTRSAAPSGQAGAIALTTNPNVQFTRQSQINDLATGRVDPRVVDLLTWIAARSRITITSMRTDHSTCVAGSSPCRVSAHHLGRAFDIGAVNGQICTGIPGAECGLLYERVVNELRGTQYQPSQVIYGYDPWPDERWNFEMGNHHDHIHIGY
jgi:hypothetical protein